MRVWCGIDWAEAHHDVAIVDDAGALLAKTRVSDDPVGFTQLLGLLGEYAAASDEPIVVAIETAKGLLVASLRAAGFGVYAINPLAAARYRDRYSPSRANPMLAMRSCIFAANAQPEPVQGRQAIAAAAARARAALKAAGVMHRHWLGMLDVELLPDGTVRAGSYALVMETPRSGSPIVKHSTRCDDILVPRDGSWLVSRRMVTRDDLV